MSARPDLVECWIQRIPAPGSPAEYLLLHRAPDRIYPGLWQCVTGRLEPDERVPQAALREVREETGLGPDDIEAFYDLDQAATFYDEGPDAVVTSVIFAVRAATGAEIRRSAEHDDHAWLAALPAAERSVWPTYRETLDRLEHLARDPALARFFALDPAGHRVARGPRW